jgi:membrane protein
MRRLAASWRHLGLAAWRALGRVLTSDDLTFASSIAYYALVSLPPILLLIFSVLANVTADAPARAAVLRFVLRFFPQQIDLMRSQLEAMEGTTVSLGLAGFFLILWFSLGVFKAVTGAVNHAWNVEERPSFFRHQLTSFLMLLGAGALLLFVVLVVTLVGMFDTLRVVEIGRLLPGVDLLEGLIYRYAATLLLIVVLGLVFYFVPNAPVRFRDVWVGAILTGLLWRVMLSVFSWYLRAFSTMSVSGSIGTVVAFMLWVYMSAVIFLYGVEFTAAHARLRGARRRPVSGML